MSFYQECLTRGQYLSQSEKEALYKYLLTSKKLLFKIDAARLLSECVLESSIANGEISYKISKNTVSYSCRKKGDQDGVDYVRERRLGSGQYFNIRRLTEFFAQAEVDVLSNFPLPGIGQNADRNFGFNTIPYYDLNHFSNGRGRILGMVKKIEQRDSNLLSKLRAM